jgi:hypothetical protein
LDELDELRRTAAGATLRGEPKHLLIQRNGSEGTDGPGAAKIMVGLDHERLDPVRDRAERLHIVLD